MKNQLEKLGFVAQSMNELSWFEFELPTCTLVVDANSPNVFVDDHLGDSVQIAQNATIEQITNILNALKS